MRNTIVSMLFAAALAGGCYGSEVQYRGGVAVTASTPDLVYVQPGVGVIADYDEPIFYADNYYWWFYNGAWYRSNYYTGGWVYVSSPSVRIARIGNPYYYRHYRPHNYVVRHRPVPVHRIQRPVVRDHRATRERYYRR